MNCRGTAYCSATDVVKVCVYRLRDISVYRARVSWFSRRGGTTGKLQKDVGSVWVLEMHGEGGRGVSRDLPRRYDRRCRNKGHRTDDASVLMEPLLAEGRVPRCGRCPDWGVCRTIPSDKEGETRRSSSGRRCHAWSVGVGDDRGSGSADEQGVAIGTNTDSKVGGVAISQE